MRMITCAQCGQEKPHYAHGLCRACYNQTYVRPTIACAQCGEQKPHRGHGLCVACYNKTHVRPTVTCAQCGQEKPHNAHGLCAACYGKTGRPIVTCAQCGQEKPHYAHGLCEACLQRINAALKGRMPRHKMRGQLQPNWRGGRFVHCAICGRDAGWRVPSRQNKKTGFRCRLHKGIKIKDEDYDPTFELLKTLVDTVQPIVA